ncbi:hypothetical protein BD779DRAFT_938327 [Infundibulicybe gibba]|nr:hypothetical protein BD779DRAFT_938327 [Infundibulicybe gibba]
MVLASSSIIDRIPAEVWSEIFLHCIPDSRDHPPQTFDIIPLNLTHVCAKWARVAHTSPRLWSSLVITIKPHGIFPPIADAEKWLGRSGSIPLVLAVDQQTCSRRKLEDAIRLFARYVHRWKHVRIQHFVPESIRAAGGDWAAPLLESLELTTNTVVNHRTPVDFSTLLGRASALRSLRLSRSDVPQGRLPWEQLTSLAHTGDSSRKDVFHLVWKCPELRDLTISLRGFANSLNHPAPAIAADSITHDRLRSLRIKASREELAAFLKCATLPSLTELRILAQFHSPEGQLCPGVLNDFLERSSAKLEVLTVVGTLPGDLVGYARNPNLQSLATLSLEGLPHNGWGFPGPMFTAADFRSLIWGGEGRAFLLPNLQSLRLGASRKSWQRGTADIRDAFTHMRTSRRCPPADQPCPGLSVELGPAEASDIYDDIFDSGPLPSSSAAFFLSLDGHVNHQGD